MAFAQITMVGNLGKDPDMSYTPDGVAVTKFSVAVNRKQGGKDTTTWYNCTAWRKLAEVINQYAKKGQMVLVQGELTPREYTGRDSQAHVSLDVAVEKFQFLGKREGASGDGDDSDEAPF